MLNSIQHFIENGVPNLQKAPKDFSENPIDFAGFVSRVRNEAFSGCEYFISTDKRLLKYKSNKIKLVTPVEFVIEMEGTE